MKYFFPMLGLLFIALKLTGYIGWSWVWVTAPLWGSVVLSILIFVVTVVLTWRFGGPSR